MDSGTLLSVVFGGLLALFSLVVVGYSFLRGTGGPEDGAPSAAATGGLEADSGELPLEALYDSLETLQLEYRLGNLPEAQYREQFESYRQQAAALIKRQLESGAADPELRLEAEVLAARGRLPQPAPADEFEAGPPPGSSNAPAASDDGSPPTTAAGDTDTATDSAPGASGSGEPAASEQAPAASGDYQPPAARRIPPGGGEAAQ